MGGCLRLYYANNKETVFMKIRYTAKPPERFRPGGSLFVINGYFRLYGRTSMQDSNILNFFRRAAGTEIDSSYLI